MKIRSFAASLEDPVEVPLDSVERRLAEIWDTRGQTAVVRACSCNLIAIARDRKEAQAFLSLLTAVSEQHPCRAIIAYRESDQSDCIPTGPHIHTWISAHCTLPASGGLQVCSETIMVASCGATATDVKHADVSLLIRFG